MNILVIMDEVNHPYRECTPDFGNWEHVYHLFHGIEVLMPYVHREGRTAFGAGRTCPDAVASCAPPRRPRSEAPPLLDERSCITKSVEPSSCGVSRNVRTPLKMAAVAPAPLMQQR